MFQETKHGVGQVCNDANYKYKDIEQYETGNYHDMDGQKFGKEDVPKGLRSGKNLFPRVVSEFYLRH